MGAAAMAILRGGLPGANAGPFAVACGSGAVGLSGIPWGAAASGTKAIDGRASPSEFLTN